MVTDATGVGIGLMTLAATIFFCIWGGRRLRLFAALIGLIAGCVVAALLGMIDWTGVLEMAHQHPVALPRPIGGFLPHPIGLEDPAGGLRLAFSIGLAPDFFVAALACALRAIGDLTTCDKINDSDWVRPDLVAIRRGIIADGLGTVVAGVLGTIGLNTFSGSIGLSVATGITSRTVGLAIGAIFVILSLLPPFSALLVAIPQQVTGGVLVFAAGFIVINGIQVMTSRLLDNRKIIMIGTALVCGLSRDLYPAFYGALPSWAIGAVGSDLVVTLGVAILLNLLFRIGIRRTGQMTIRAGTLPDDITETIQRLGSEWGARRDIITNVSSALIEFCEAGSELMPPGEAARVGIRYDEFTIVVTIRYRGRPLFTEAADVLPSLLELGPDTYVAHFHERLLRRVADRVRTQEHGGEQLIRLQFDH